MAEKKQNAAVKGVVGEAVEQLFAQDGFLLEANAAERTIAARLAVYLELRFPKYHVNVEYNRHGLHPKRLNLPAYGGKKLILPDVVVHRQGHDENNLLVIQVKKETNNENRDYDRAVIAGMKRDYGYTFDPLLVGSTDTASTKGLTAELYSPNGSCCEKAGASLVSVLAQFDAVSCSLNFARGPKFSSTCSFGLWHATELGRIMSPLL